MDAPLVSFSTLDSGLYNILCNLNKSHGRFLTFKNTKCIWGFCGESLRLRYKDAVWSVFGSLTDDLFSVTEEK